MASAFSYNQQDLPKNVDCFDISIKCGEIFYHKIGPSIIITFQCDICQLIYNRLNKFVEHVQTVHCNMNGQTENLINSAEEEEEEEKEKQKSEHLQQLYINKEYIFESDDEVESMQNYSDNGSTLCDNDSILSKTSLPSNDINTSEREVLTNDSVVGCKEWESDNNDENLHRLELMNGYMCEHCPKVFKARWNLFLHSYSHSDKKLKSINSKCFNPCSSPTRVTYSPKERVHKCICQDCLHPTSIGSQSFLEYNKNPLHLNDDENSLTCNLCQRYFRKRYQLKIHQITVHKELSRPIESSRVLGKTVYKFKTNENIPERNIFNNTKDEKTTQVSDVYKQKTYHHKKKKNLMVTFSEPIREDISELRNRNHHLNEWKK